MGGGLGGHVLDAYFAFMRVDVFLEKMQIAERPKVRKIVARGTLSVLTPLSKVRES